MVPRVLTQLRSRMATHNKPETSQVPVRPPDRPAARPARPPISVPASATAPDYVASEIYVPRVLRTSAALGWRFLVVVAALYVIGTVAGYLAAVVVPVAIALLLAALLAPAVHWLQERSVPRGVATMTVMVGGLALLGGVLTFVVVTFVRGVPDLGNQLAASVDAVVSWLTNGPLKMSEAQMRGAQDQLLATVNANQASITAGALTTAAADR